MLLARVLILTLVASAVGSSTVVAGSPGRIVVSNDVWWTSDYGFSQTPTGSAKFSLNIGEFFAAGGSGHFLLHVENSLPWLTQASFRNALTSSGHTLTNSADVPGFTFNLATLLNYDAVFITRQYASPTDVGAAVLVDYVNAGGNVFVGLGIGLNNDTGIDEATAWNPFLNAFGLDVLPFYNGIQGNIPIASSHPLMNGVDALYQNNGSTITLLGSDASAQIIASYQAEGLYAVYDPAHTLTVPLDIKPGTDQNSIALSDGGLLPVAFLGSGSFNVMNIDAATLELGGVDIALRGSPKRPKLFASFGDVNGDGVLDLVSWFEVPTLVSAGALTSSTIVLDLAGKLLDGTLIQGRDSVRVVP